MTSAAEQYAATQWEGPVLRAIVPADAPLLAAIHGEAFGKEAWKVEEFSSTLAAPARCGYLCRSGIAPVGFVLCQAVGEDAEILTIAVLPRYQQRGFGKYLLQQVMREAGEAGANRMLLEVAADNHAAQRLYQKFGFKPLGKRRDYYQRGAVRVDALTFSCDLPYANQ
jgi:[ribosomal protein S18]-alanine N-acetyltransferase